MTLVNFDSLDNVDLAAAETKVIVETSAIRTETIESNRIRGSAEYQSEGTLRIEMTPELSLINLDAYFDPDYFYDWPNELTNEAADGSTVRILPSFASYEIRFEPIEDELYVAAEKRAAEDHTHVVNVLASWLWQTNRGHIHDTVSSIFYSLLKNAVEHHDDPPEWAVCYDGSPHRWRHDVPAITDLDEAADFARGGWQRVNRSRSEENQK